MKPDKQEKVYVAGALSADACNYIKNLHRMCEWALELRGCGFCVFVPGLDFLMGFLHGEWNYEDYFENNQPWLLASDAVFLVPGWEHSKGTKKEIQLAKNVGIPVCTDIEELIEILRPVT